MDRIVFSFPEALQVAENKMPACGAEIKKPCPDACKCQLALELCRKNMEDTKASQTETEKFFEEAGGFSFDDALDFFAKMEAKDFFKNKFGISFEEAYEHFSEVEMEKISRCTKIMMALQNLKKFAKFEEQSLEKIQ